MWKSHGHHRRMKDTSTPLSNAHSEAAIENRDKTIRELVEGLVSDTKELKEHLYGGKNAPQ